MINWSQRYASRPRCTFCHGPSHFVKNAVEWTPENAYTLGLPRPSTSTETANPGKDIVLHKRVPIPFVAEFLSNGGAPLNNYDREQMAIKEHKCPMCGIAFGEDEKAVRFSDFFKRIQRDSTGSTEGDLRSNDRMCLADHFDQGPIEELRDRATQHTASQIKDYLQYTVGLSKGNWKRLKNVLLSVPDVSRHLHTDEVKSFGNFYKD